MTEIIPLCRRMIEDMTMHPVPDPPGASSPAALKLSGTAIISTSATPGVPRLDLLAGTAPPNANV